MRLGLRLRLSLWRLLGLTLGLLYALSLDSLQLLLDVSQFFLLPLDVGLDHSCPLLQLLL